MKTILFALILSTSIFAVGQETGNGADHIYTGTVEVDGEVFEAIIKLSEENVVRIEGLEPNGTTIEADEDPKKVEINVIIDDDE